MGENTLEESVKIGRKYMDDLLFCQENDRNYQNDGVGIPKSGDVWEGERQRKFKERNPAAW